jgi:rhodanese-related sulfurtransferase
MAMRHAICLVALTVAALAIAGDARAQSASIFQSTLAEANQSTPEVSTEQVRGIVADASAIVLDTRSRDEYEAGHIPGARNLDAAGSPVEAVERLVNGDKSKALVLYCNGPYCQASRRLAEQLVAAGFTNVRRYQLGIPIWRALGGPTAIELGGIARVFKLDRTAVFFDASSAEEFAKGSLSGAHNVPVADVASGKLTKLPMPGDDFNRRVILFARDPAQARKLADILSTRPWHNVAYYPGAFAALVGALAGK